MKAGDVDRLIADLRGADRLARDAASARLRVTGIAALSRLAALVRTDLDASTRVAALSTLDGIDDPRIIGVALHALEDPESSVRLAAIAVLRSWLTREPGTRVLEALSGLALDRLQISEVRLAALDALSDLPSTVVQPVLEQAPDSGPSQHFDDPQRAREWVARHDVGPLSYLHDALVTFRESERTESSARRRQEWRVTRGAVHAALAKRGSRVALYDLREAFDAATEPLPLDYLTAVTAIGDATCLEPLARAWAAAPPTETWWRDRLADAAADIVRREHLTGRSAIVKRIRSKWAGFV